jgi:hypothetical protein
MKKKRITKLKGDGIFEDVNKFLKQSKLASKVGEVLLPVAGGALGGLFTANPLGSVAGTAGGLALNDFLKAQGYGKMKGRGYTNKPLMLGSGMTYGYNGVYQQIPKMRGMGGTAYGMVSSEFGKIQA